jgi:hypothetical protein
MPNVFSFLMPNESVTDILIWLSFESDIGPDENLPDKSSSGVKVFIGEFMLFTYIDSVEFGFVEPEKVIDSLL